MFVLPTTSPNQNFSFHNHDDRGEFKNYKETSKRKDELVTTSSSFNLIPLDYHLVSARESLLHRFVSGKRGFPKP